MTITVDRCKSNCGRGAPHARVRRDDRRRTARFSRKMTAHNGGGGGVDTVQYAHYCAASARSNSRERNFGVATKVITLTLLVMDPFSIDREGLNSPTTDDQPSASTKAAVSGPLFSAVCDVTLGTPSPTVNSKNRGRCWNCDGDHTLRECQRPRDARRIALARSQQQARSSNVRYTGQAERQNGGVEELPSRTVEMLEKFRPGSLR